ncbi:Fanconi anemia core complex-associated protein 24-like [Neocloeon triangulifer]|uniref:Fanconi anemia core complex-associated protein 24-like n=1 Tax=Neocloeon triangulifer TaxID=2078957 RepID=UPI00286EC87B|nr:Fanconi anemia core complex-associated protein 24-like [Neocloeon triangulifer]
MDIPLSKLPNVPFGKILVNETWSKTELGVELSRHHGGLQFSLAGAFVDFVPAQNLPVILFYTGNYPSNDADIIAKLKNFKKCWKGAGVIMAERNSSTCQLYNSVQSLATLKLAKNVVPVSNLQEVPDLLKDLAQAAKNKNNNPFLVKIPLQVDLASKQISLLTKIPNVGRNKAQILVEHFFTIRRISYATEDELSVHIGKSSAESVYKFFH